MDGFRRTVTYPSNGWVQNQPLHFFLGFPPVRLQGHAKQEEEILDDEWYDDVVDDDEEEED